MNLELKHIIDTQFDSDQNEIRYKVQPKQKEFLIKLQSFQSQELYSEIEQICIVHCLRYNHYSDLHKDSLNNLISKYSRLV